MLRTLRRCWRASARAEVLVAGMLAAGFAGSGLVSRADITSHRDTAATAAAPPTVVDNDTTLVAGIDEYQRARWLQAAYAAEQEAKWHQAIDQQRAEQAARREQMWDRLAQCETAGDWSNGGDYGGGLGIYVGTWRMYGGEEFAARPQYATKAQQIIVAERIALDGMGGWGCADRLGLV